MWEEKKAKKKERENLLKKKKMLLGTETSWEKNGEVDKKERKERKRGRK